MYSIRQYRNRIEIININTTDKRWNGGVMSIFTGAGVAIVTPMKANGEINYDKLAELLDYQINNSTDAIVICGTTGESATMTEKEHIEAIRFTADYVKKRVPVVAGTSPLPARRPWQWHPSCPWHPRSAPARHRKPSSAGGAPRSWSRASR